MLHWSRDLSIRWVIETNWLVQESPARKPDWLLSRILFDSKNWYRAGNIPLFKALLKIVNKGLMIDESHILIMRIEIPSKPWDLLESSECIKFKRSHALNWMREIVFGVFIGMLFGNTLELSIIEHCLEKNELKISDFSLKS